jgi:hypothetical protein
MGVVDSRFDEIEDLFGDFVVVHTCSLPQA